MKIKKVEKNEEPDYDTKNERKNKFLRLVCDHKKMIIVILVALIIAICGAFIIHCYNYTYNYTIGGSSPYNWEQQFLEHIDEFTDVLKQYEGEVSGVDVKTLIRRVKLYKEYNVFIILNIDDSLKSDEGKTYYEGEKYTILNSKTYKVTMSYDSGKISSISITEN